MLHISDMPSLVEHLESTHALFVADLHLSESCPALTSAFLQLLDAALQAHIKAFYILGDWFDAWVGDDWLDDASGVWLRPIVTKLNLLTARGVRVYFCHGNRDFGIAQPFLDLFGGRLLPAVSQCEHGGKTYRLEHGDLLCTDDVRYQRFRKVIRNPLVLYVLRRLPLDSRKRIALKLRSQSTLETTQKSQYIMDVNARAVTNALNDVDALIHGHTHRPKVHELGGGKLRYVLGDWRSVGDKKTGTIEAVIGVLKHEFELVNIQLKQATLDNL